MVGNSPLRAVALPQRNNQGIALTNSPTIMKDPLKINWRITPDLPLYPTGVKMPGALPPVKAVILGSVPHRDRTYFEAHINAMDVVTNSSFLPFSKKKIYILFSTPYLTQRVILLQWKFVVFHFCQKKKHINFGFPPQTQTHPPTNELSTGATINRTSTPDCRAQGRWDEEHTPHTNHNLERKATGMKKRRLGLVFARD